MTPNLIECPACHTPNPITATQCKNCATPIPVSDSAFLDNTKKNDRAVPGEDPQDDATLVGGGKTGDVTDISAAGWSRPSAQSSRVVFHFGRLSPHTKLGSRYEILELLGEGGMGAVYKAMDCELERTVALKIIRPELATQERILARFKQELILARRITDKNVIRIFDLGEAEGLKFITMEFVEGKDLSSLIREKGRLSFEEIADVMSQACSALDAAHSEGVVHRDLKPQNIMVDKNGKVKVMDFGIARTMEPGGMTQTGALLGTPDYMSPEQVMGEHVDPRSDIFTLGIIFYQLLIGKLPYQAKTIQSAMFMRTREAPRPPHEVDPAVPSLLSDITVKCTQLDPELRYQNVSDIRRDIEAWRSGSTKRIELPVPLPPPEPVKIPLWRRPAVWGAVGILFLVSAGGAYLGRIYTKPSNAKPMLAAPLTSLAILPFHNSSNDAKLDWLGTSMAEMLSTDVGQSTKVRTVSADRVGQVLRDLRLSPQTELDPTTVARIAGLSNVDLVVWGHYAQFGDILRIDATIQDIKRSRNVALKEEATSEKDILPAMDRLATQIRNNLSVSASLIKELQQKAFKPSTSSIAALRAYDQGLQGARRGNYADAVIEFQSALKQDPNFALAYSKLAQSYASLGQDDEAEQAAQKALSLSASLSGQEKYLIQANHDQILRDYPKAIEAYENLVKASPGNTEYLLGLGEAYEQTAAYDKARDVFQKVVELDPKRIEGLRAFGRVDVKSGNTQKGLESLARAQSLAIELGDEAERARVLQVIGVAYYLIPRYDDALKTLQESLDIKKRLNMKKGIAESLDMMATVQDLTGKSDVALNNYTQALTIMRDLGDKQGTADVLTDLGALKLEHGKYDEALKLFKESLQLHIEVHNETSLGLVLNNIGSIYLAKGDFDNARTYFTQALEVREKLKVTVDILDTTHNLAETAMKTGQFDEAQAKYFRVMELRRSIGDMKGAATETSSMGALFADQGRYGAAISAQEDALKDFEQSKEQGFMATEIVMAYGNALALAGRADEAAKYLTGALNAAREQKSQPQIAAALSYQGDNAFYRGDLKSAAALYAEALQTAAKTGDQALILRTKVSLARLAIQQGKFPTALSALGGLSEEADSLSLRYLSAVCLLLRGQALIGTKDYAGAKKDLKSAVSRSEKLGLLVLQAQSHFELARALALSGNTQEADSQEQEARRLAEKIVKEAQSDAVKKRADLSPLFLTRPS
jgi:eukaryotic-like serine/threonine-protein kinase